MEKFSAKQSDTAVYYLKPTELPRQQLLHEETKRFFGTYQPDESDEEGFTFDFDKSEAGPLLFELILWDDDGLKRLIQQKKDVSNLAPTEADESRWGNNRWDWPCFEQPKESAPKSDHPGL